MFLVVVGFGLVLVVNVVDGMIMFIGNVIVVICKIDGFVVGVMLNKLVLMLMVSLGVLNVVGVVVGCIVFGFKLIGCVVDSEISKGNLMKV